MADDQSTHDSHPGRAIFISYRRSDTEGEAGRLYDDLVRAYSDDSVFMDVTGIQPGLDFRKAIDSNIAGCGVLLAVIGPNWATATDSSGKLRFENPNDYVRLEIASALAKQIPVIPVLVHGAHMPPLEQLPDDLKDLRYRNSVELTHARWNSDVALLIGALKNYVSAAPTHPTETVHATVPVQLPAPQATPSAPAVANSRTPLFAGISAAAVLLAVAVGYFAFHNKADVGSNGSQQAVNQSAATPSATTTPSTAAETTVTSPQPAAQPAAISTPAKGPTATRVSPPGDNGPASPWIGSWELATKETGADALDSLTLLNVGGQLSAHAYGNCGGTVCDWGVRKLTLKDNLAVSDPWQPRFVAADTTMNRKVSVSLALSGDMLVATVINERTNPHADTASVGHQAKFKRVK